MNDNAAYHEAFSIFKELVLEASGHPFTNFNEGIAAVWESYKPRLREHALNILNPAEWDEGEIGEGVILEATISAIEIQSSQSNLTNNLVFWQNRFGHASRAHKSFIEAKTDKALCEKIERALFDLFRDNRDGLAFEALNQITGGKYPLIAYMFFLKDSSRYMPILPDTYDKAFVKLNINLVTQRQCSWGNYQAYNNALANVAAFLKENVVQSDLSLIDAHSFCFLLIRIAKELEKNKTSGATSSNDGVILGEKANRVYDMINSVNKTVVNSNGQEVTRTVKNKDLKMSKQELEAEILRLLDIQQNGCALTGLALDFANKTDDIQMRPSLDRIDSDAHYEKGNLQVVCRFINFWKGAQDNDEFIRLLSIIRNNLDVL